MNKVKSSIKTKINAELKNYDSAQSNEEKAKSLTLISKELNMALAIDKQENDDVRTSEQIKTERARQKLEAERLKFEKEKFKEDLKRRQEEAKIDLERRKEESELNATRLELEKRKVESEESDRKARLEEEKRHNRNQLIVAIVGAVVPAAITIVSKCIYAGLAFNAQKHDYKDYVMESKYSKEQRDNLNK